MDTQHRRLRALSRHVAVAAAQAQEQQGDGADGLALLSAEELAQFVRDGFWSAKIGDLPDAFHAEFGAQMREMWERGQADSQWLDLEPALLDLLRTPTFKGALTSILGSDFQMAAPWCNKKGQGGMIGLHITAPTNGFSGDQQFHKDGTDHGNTQSTVRDNRQRQVIMMYYPLGASLEMGPTGVVPGSQYYALDRGERPSSSEISLLAPGGPMPEDFEERDAWLQESADLIGGSAEMGFVNHRVEVAPGSVIITHHQLFHRASRAEEGSFRPMVKLGAARISEPVPPASSTADAPLPSTLPPTALLRTMWGYTRGSMQASVGSDDAQQVELDQLVETLRTDLSDVSRMEAAHVLAEQAVAAGGSGPAMTALVETFKLHLANEAGSRNAMYGLAAVGFAAVPAACDVLATAAAAGQTDEAASGWKLACNCAHILGQAATTHETQLLALEALGAAMATAQAEIDAHVARNVKVEDGRLDFYSMERRRLLAEGCCASGLIGHRAGIADDCAVAMAALELVLFSATRDEPAEDLPSFMWPGTVLNNAGCALLRLFSDAAVPELQNPIAPVFVRDNDNAIRMLSGSIQEAHRRAAVLTAAAPSATRLAMSERLQSVEWGKAVEELFQEL